MRVCGCNVFLFRFLLYLSCPLPSCSVTPEFSATLFSPLPYYTPAHPLPLLYANVAALLLLIAAPLHFLSFEPPPSDWPPILRLPSLWGHYPRHHSSSAITAPFSRLGLYQMNTFLSLAPRWRTVLDLTIASDIQALTKPHISKYSCFSLLLSNKARHHCATTASVLVIPSAE